MAGYEGGRDVELGRVLPHPVGKTGAFDLDHIGAEIGKQAAALCTDHDRAEIEDLEARKGKIA